MSQGSWQPDPYGRHQFRWWDGAQWSTLVSDNGVTTDEAASAAAAPMPTPPPMMGAPSMPSPAKSNRNVFIAIAAVVVLVAAGLVVFFLVRDDNGGDASSRDTEDVRTTDDSRTTDETRTTDEVQPSDDAQAYVDAMIASGDMSQFSEDEARCLAESVIDIIGVDRLQEAGITPENIGTSDGLLEGYEPSAEDANQLVDRMFTCIDFGEMIATQMADSGLDLTPDQLQCIGDEFGNIGQFRDYMAASILAETTDGTAPDDVAMEQLTLEVFTFCGVDMSGG